MQWKPQDKWPPRLTAFGVALLLGASVTYWTLQWPVAHSTNINIAAAQAELPAPDTNALARALGASGTAANPAADAATVSRLSLIGVVARSGGAGSAIISVDGRPPKSFAVGSEIESGLVLKSVAPRKAMLGSNGDSPATQTLEMPARPAAD